MSRRQRRRRVSRRRLHSDLRVARRALLAAGGLGAGATFAFSGSALAAQTYTVGTPADNSAVGDCTSPANTDCTLRQAIGLANANAGGDTILFSASLSGQTRLMSGAVTSACHASVRHKSRSVTYGPFLYL